jgi:hypothetical protein
MPAGTRAFVDMVVDCPRQLGRRNVAERMDLDNSESRPQLFLCPEVAENLGKKTTSQPYWIIVS